MSISWLPRWLVDTVHKSHKSRKEKTMRANASRVGSLLMVLVLTLGFALMPVSADVGLATVTGVTVTVDPTTQGFAAKYTVVFTTTQYLSAPGATISIEFPSTTAVAGYDGTVTVNGTPVTGACVIAVKKVTFPVAADVPVGTVL